MNNYRMFQQLNTESHTNQPTISPKAVRIKYHMYYQQRTAESHTNQPTPSPKAVRIKQHMYYQQRTAAYHIKQLTPSYKAPRSCRPIWAHRSPVTPKFHPGTPLLNQRS
jgi:hypothetical protein